MTTHHRYISHTKNAKFGITKLFFCGGQFSKLLMWFVIRNGKSKKIILCERQYSNCYGGLLSYEVYVKLCIICEFVCACVGKFILPIRYRLLFEKLRSHSSHNFSLVGGRCDEKPNFIIMAVLALLTLMICTVLY